jgi:single-stranded DNA-binding protein
MNDVVLSAILKGGFQDVSNDGVQFTLVSRSGKGTDLDEFTVLAYGNSAKFLQQHASSGARVVVQGRLSSEKLDTEIYHNAITVNRVLSISKAEQGIDYSRAVISGLSSCESVKTAGKNGTNLAGLNIANARKYVGKSGEEKSYTTYISATIWGDRAVQLESQGLIPMQEENVTIEGILKPRTYENKDGQSVRKIDVWVDDIVFASAQFSQEPRRRTTDQETEKPQTRVSSSQQTKSIDSSPF